MLSKYRTIEQLAAALRSIFGFGNFGYHVRAYNNANITIGTGAATVLTLNTGQIDPYDMHSTVSNTSRLTSTLSGWYTISSAVEFESNATGIRIVYIVYGGATHIAQNSTTALNGFTTRLSVNSQYYLSDGDYVETFVYQNSGGDLDIVASGNYSPFFMMSRIA